MVKKIRIGSFNVQNLFQRAKALNYMSHDKVDQTLVKVQEFKDLIGKEEYTDADKNRIFTLYTKELKEFIEVQENRGKLFSRQGLKITGVKAKGKGNDWDGEVAFKPDSFDSVTRENTAKVIKDIRSDILCMVEVEDRPTLVSFDAQMLGSRYPYDFLIDGNDERGIDVGLYSKYPMGRIRTHIFDRKGSSKIFSRDCMEAEVKISEDQSIYFLCNHLKSKGYDKNNTADNRRRQQAEEVAKILKGYDLKRDWVVVAGDFNDHPKSAPLKPLLTVPGLYDVLDLQFGDDIAQRWTYHYKSFDQIDYILVSEPLKQRFVRAGVFRKGIPGLETLTKSAKEGVPVEKEYESVTKWSNAASDHGAVWAEFSV